MKNRIPAIICFTAIALALCAYAHCATIQGYILDPNWWAKHPKLTSPQVYGTGVYEYGVSGNINNSTELGFYSNTENYADNYNWGVYGYFRGTGQTDGTYCLATWDTWWRSAYLFNQNLVGYPSALVMRLHANMWSYAPTWEGNYTEFGQTFAATGTSVTMVVVRSAASVPNVRVSIHKGGPSGPQIGPSRTMSLDSGPTDARFIWNGGEVATIPGEIYYVKILAPNNTMVICNNEPIPDFSDAAPEGCAYHNGVSWGDTAAHPDTGKQMDLGLTICSDDDGLLTNLHTGKGSSGPSGVRVGETFVARGTSLLSFAAWVSDSSPTYVATLYDGVGGAQIGVAKKNKCMRWADPEVIFTWAPNECPLTPGNTYYIEITREDGAYLTSLGHNWDPYPNGTAYANRAAMNGWDIGGTIMEEESPGSATRQTVQFLSTYPGVARADRGARSLTVRWITNVASDSTVEYSAWTTPYTNTYYSSSLVTGHIATLTGLEPNTMYHIRVKSAASGKNPAITHDFVACTTNETPNLLANPSFEEGTGSSPRMPISGWTTTGMDIRASDGTWFWGMPPYAGSWFCQCAVNGSSCQGYVYQTVDATPGMEYDLTLAVTSWMRENGTYKYDVWQQQGRLDFIKVGIDPFGGNDPTSANIRWTPAFYSHLHYTTVGIRQVAQSNRITVVISLKGTGGEWHLYGIDDCRLTETNPYVGYGLADLKKNKPDGTRAEVGSLTVTAAPDQAGAYYAQTSDRTQGIRIEATSGGAVIGDTVVVRGELRTDPQTGEKSLINASLVSTTPGAAAKPLLMQCKAIGGAVWGPIRAVSGSVGAPNTDLLVKVCGVVAYVDLGSQTFLINDGSVPGNGIWVDASRIPAFPIPSESDIVSVTGISSRFYGGGEILPLVIARTNDDVRPMAY